MMRLPLKVSRALSSAAFALAALGAPLAAQTETKSAAEAADASGPTLRGNTLILPAQTRLAFVVAEEVSSKKARKGDLIALTLRDDLVFNGTLIVPAGAPAIGEITRANKKGWMGEGGRLAARMLYFDFESGPVRISGPLGGTGDDQTELATLTVLATGGLVPFVTGKSAVIAEGTELSAVLDREARIPFIAPPVSD